MLNDMIPSRGREIDQGHKAMSRSHRPGRLRFEEDRLFEEAASSRPVSDFSTRSPASPAVELTETEEGYCLIAELPGVGGSQIEIIVSDGEISLAGEIPCSDEMPGRNILLSERRFGRFHRRFRLGDAFDAEQASATLCHGILTIVLPRLQGREPRGHKISIVAS